MLTGSVRSSGPTSTLPASTARRGWASITSAAVSSTPFALVEIWALDPKLMELSFGQELFTRYAAHPGDCADLLEDAVDVM
ncbi:hypothetical protein [Nonomuraea dietziae]|uniref:hypothetical protein n=1 Tax=Nonomuraea dietziae TaxID=65515 RepID=UPI0034001B67